MQKLMRQERVESVRGRRIALYKSNQQQQQQQQHVTFTVAKFCWVATATGRPQRFLYSNVVLPSICDFLFSVIILYVNELAVDKPLASW